ncbi:MAG: hypothetical protein ACYS22_04360 [Planctomycetota bacterium]
MRRLILGALFGALVAGSASMVATPKTSLWPAGAATAHAQGGLVVGAGQAGTVDDPVRWKIAKKRFQIAKATRSVVKVPEEFGRFVTVSGSREGSVLWFEGADGSIRNVVLRVSDTLVKVDREPPLQ